MQGNENYMNTKIIQMKTNISRIFPPDYIGTEPFHELREVIELPLIHREHLQRCDITQPKSCLLYGLEGGFNQNLNLLCLQLINFNTHINPRRQDNIIYLTSHRTKYGQSEPVTRMSRVFNLNYDTIDFNLS